MDLSRIIIFTQDVMRMTDFYTTVFGLEPIGEFDDDWAEMKTGGCSIAFHKVNFDIDSSQDNGVKIVFGTDDVAGERERLTALGIDMTEIFKFGEIEMCDGSDPDGHRFQISSRGVSLP